MDLWLPLRFEMFNSSQALASYHDEIDQFQRRFGDAFFISPAWLIPFQETFLEDNQANHIIGFDNTGKCRGSLHFSIAPTQFLKLFRPKVMALMGTRGAVSPEHLDFPIDESRQTDWFEYLEKYLTIRKSDFDFLIFDSVAESAYNIRKFAGLIEKRGYRVISQVQDTCRYLELPETFEELIAGFSYKKRKSTRYELKRNRETMKIVDYSDLGSFMEMFEVAHQLHNLSRGKKGEVGSFDRKGYIGFHNELVESMKGKAELYFRFILSGRVPIAFRYGFISGDTYYDYQTGYDPAYEKNRPGFLTVALTIQGLISKGVKKYDFLRGDEPYKKYWADKYKRTLRYYIFPPGLKRSFYYLLLKAYLRLK